MAFSTEEEETLEALKRWWNESGKSLLIGVIVFAVGYLGWMQWQRTHSSGMAAASDLYEQMGAALIVPPGQDVSEELRSTALTTIAQLKNDYPKSVYALYGALFGARLAVEDNDLNRAESELQWLLDNANTGFFGTADQGLVLTAQMRLARIIVSKGEPQRALDLLAGVTPGSFEADYNEIRGDAYFSLGQVDAARASYEAAIQAGADTPALQMKLADVSGQQE